MAGIILKLVVLIAALNVCRISGLALKTYHDHGILKDNVTGEPYRMLTFLGKRNGIDEEEWTYEKLPWDGRITSTRPIVYYPVNWSLPLSTNWKADGWSDCKIWQTPRNTWGCHNKHGFTKWLNVMNERGHDAPKEIRKLLQVILQDPKGQRPLEVPRAICIVPHGYPIDSDVRLCVSWADVFKSVMTDAVLQKVLDKALSCGAQGHSAAIMARMVDWQNRVICISDRPKGCKSAICNDMPAMGSWREQCGIMDWLENHFGMPARTKPRPCIMRSPSEQLNQYDLPPDVSPPEDWFPWGDFGPDWELFKKGQKKGPLTPTSPWVPAGHQDYEDNFRNPWVGRIGDD